MAMDFKTQIDKNNVPEHIAIIMDGNGRWAKKQGRLRTFGHKIGVKAVRETVEGASEIGVKFLTMYTFSTENWKRPAGEIKALMELLVKSIHKETPTLNQNNIRLQAIGNLEQLPEKARLQLQKSIDETSQNTGMHLILALSYSARWEILHATRRLADKVAQGLIKPDEISEAVFQAELCTAQYPDPELLIRTSGELRISNYLLWQIAYSELYFTPKLWPDFTREDLFEAIVNYQQRERRFGLVSDQMLVH